MDSTELRLDHLQQKHLVQFQPYVRTQTSRPTYLRLDERSKKVNN